MPEHISTQTVVISVDLVLCYPACSFLAQLPYVGSGCCLAFSNRFSTPRRAV